MRRNEHGHIRLESVWLLALATMLGISAWVLSQSISYQREETARIYLEDAIHPGRLRLIPFATSIGGSTAARVPQWDIAELRYGRLYAPVTSASIGWKATPLVVDNVTWLQLQRFTYLEELQLSACVVNASADFSPFLNLRRLTIDQTSISSRDLFTLAKLPQLRHLVLRKKRGLDRWLPGVSQIRTLAELELIGDCSDHGCEPLVKMTSLKHLSIRSNRISSKVIRTVRCIEDLRVLELCGGRIGDEGLEGLASLKQLLRLGLDNNTNISDRGVKSLASLKGLNALSLNGLDITPESARVLSTMKELRGLMLSDTPLDDVRLQCLAKLENLSVLHLGATNITDVGADLRFPALEYLNLAGTNLTDEGLRHFSHCPKLRCLVISRTQLTNASIKTLAAIPSLVFVYATGTQIDEKSPAWLRLNRELQVKRENEKVRADVDPRLRMIFGLDF